MKKNLKVLLVISILLCFLSLALLSSIVIEYKDIKELGNIEHASYFLSLNMYLIMGFTGLTIVSFLLSIMLFDMIRKEE